ncbi:MAG TPA: helix-turn-helix domain-containing protein [Blastocatellia bacterium]
MSRSVNARGGIAVSKLLTVPETAAVLGLRSDTVYAMAKAGVLPIVRIGAKAVRVSPEALQRFIEQGGTATATLAATAE